ncbi:MAG: PstA family ABC transporter permease [Cellulosilyticaceae bacterium]
MKSKIFLKCWIYTSCAITLFLTFGLFAYIFSKGLNVINFNFLFQSPDGLPLGTEGGIFPAIVGSLLLGSISTLCASLFALCSSIYVVFYAHNTPFAKLISQSLHILLGIPSVVIGLFGYSFFVMTLKLPRSLIVASFTLSFMILPFMTLRFIKIFSEFPYEYFSTSTNLGVSKHYTILHIVIPNLVGELFTTLGIAMSFSMGATAPIMYTGAVIFTNVPTKLTDSVMALPYHLYVLANEGISLDMAFGTACVLMSIVLFIHIICHTTAYTKGKK